jgi:hypothetical protein
MDVSMLHIRDVQGPKEKGTVDARIEAMEQEVLKCKGMVLLKMLMKITLPKMGEWLVMMMTMVSPSGREVPRRNRSAGGQKSSCPSSTSRRQCFVPKVLSLFFLG